jgi:mannan endo-1,4-beta-mannosidase
MRALDRSWRRLAVALVAVAALVAPLGTGTVAHAQPPSGFDFEDGVDGWFAPDWLESNAGAPFQDGTQVRSGEASLALPVRYAAGSGWEQSGAVYRFPDAPADISGYAAVSFHVYAPVAGLSADLVFNDPWNPPTSLRPLAPGWNELTFDLTPASPDWPGGVPSVNELIVRVVAQNLTETYEGPVWIDLVQFLRGTTPVLAMVSPQPDDILSVPPGEAYRIEVRASAFETRELASVSWRSASQQGTLAPDPDTGGWAGDWDIWAEGEGVVALAVTAADTEGESSTARTTVLVRNSELRVDITDPGFDAALAGTVEVVASVTEDPRFPLAEVVLYGLENELAPTTMELAPAGEPGSWTATATLDTTTLADGVESLAVEARDAHHAVRDLAHVVVGNTRPDWDFVATDQTSFTHRGEPFRYLGANEYDLFTAPPNFDRGTVTNLDQTRFGEVLLPGTEQDWREQIDRQLLEMSRNGLTVLRTWAFNRNNEESAFQRMVDGEIVFQEPTFERLDYIVDSARRHGVRVILTLDNYWGDYGGIGRAAQWLGLENKLQFFTDPAGIAFYQEYAEHLVTRVNTVNGTPYAQDPTVFAWELMNEPRSSCADDPSPDDRFCDPTGQVMRQWLAEQARFINELAPDQLVSAGGEAHGWTPTPSGGLQYGGPDEGNHNIPFFDMDIPEIDFLTFHPYPNASWAGLTKQQTRELVVSLTRMGVERGKPVAMEEWGIHRSEPVYTDDGALLEPGTPGYEAERDDHYRMMVEACYLHGCAGSNVWMVADWADRDLNINLYRPGPDAARDAALVAELRHWADRAAAGTLPPAPTPPCEVRYRVHGQWRDGFVAQVWLTNTGDATIDGWQAGWWFEDGQELSRAWGVDASQDGPLVTADNARWNARLRPGTSLTFGLLGTRDGANPVPKVFTLNGEVCGTG